jgi:mono/diheme cytochrome c family protein
VVFLLVWLVGLAAADPLRGELLAGLGGCVTCHTAEDGQPFAGGHAIETAFGTFYGTNITPHPEAGIGGWSLQDFERAMRHGRSPRGRPYYPAFPYPSFAGLTDEDLAALFGHLQQQPPSDFVAPPHQVDKRARGRVRVGLWRWVGFHPKRARAHQAEPGQYLVEVVGHCGGCHTARNGIGVPLGDRQLAGAPGPPHSAPNLTPHTDGLKGWTDADLRTYLTEGMEPDGDFAGGGMWPVIREGTAQLSPASLDALIAYLRVLPARANPPGVEEPAPSDDEQDTWDDPW